MRPLLNRHKYLFLAGTLAGLCLRLLFLYWWPHVAGDSILYIDIAKNWLLHGVFGLTEADGAAVPTYLRLPGYPGFLAMAFALVGVDNLRGALFLQIICDLGGCLVVAALAYEVLPDLWRDRAALASFWIAAFCPFTANYAALPLTESLEFLSTAAAMLFAVKGTKALLSSSGGRRYWAFSGAAIAAAILLRPDGGILLIAVELYLLGLMLQLWRKRTPGEFFLPHWKPIFSAALLVAIFALAPLAPWTLRNWRTFQEFHPLVPRYTTEANEYVPLGFDRWQKTWVVDYISVEDIGWKISADALGEAVELNNLPSRAFDSDDQRSRTAAIFADYNQALLLSPEMDGRFAALADERIAHSPLRYYLWLPIARVADMWFRPRTEMLPLEQRWWEFQDRTESGISIAFAALNFLLLAAAFIAAIRLCDLPGYWILLGFVIARSVFLSTIANPEPRYTLECYPVVFVFAGAAVAWMMTRDSI